MKKYMLFLFAITLLLASTTVFAGVKKTVSAVNQQAIVDNLNVGLTSDNYGIRVSSAYVLGQLISSEVIDADAASKTIIPLLKIFRNEKTDEARIVAGLALYHLKSGRGARFLEYAAKYDDSERLSKFSTLLYKEFRDRNK